MDINVREIRTADYNDIYLLNKEFNPERCTYPLIKVKERIRYVIENTKDIIFVCEQCNEVIGYIHGSPYELLFSDSLINVLCFVVKEKYKNTGVGSKLINSLECWAKDNNFSGVKLLTHPWTAYKLHKTSLLIPITFPFSSVVYYNTLL